jgi:Ca-activated chloride channel homolog
MRSILALVVVVLGALLAVPASAAERTIIVLDGSGSMWGQIDGTAQISIARNSLRGVLGSVPDDLELGFMSYGHRIKGDCADIELMVPPAPGTAKQIEAAAAGISPLGKTPLSEAVRQAAEALAFTEDKATVILITDGIETCNADPCALGLELEAQGINFTVDVVGFGLTEEEGKTVACLAENTGGTYYDAKDAGALSDALKTTVSVVAQAEVEPVAVEPEAPIAPAFNLIPHATLAEGGAPLDPNIGIAWEVYRANPDGTEGEYLTTEYGTEYEGSFEPGNYVVRANVGEVHVAQPVTIEEGKVAEPHFVMNAGHLVIHPRIVEGAAVDGGAAVVIAYPGGETTTYGDTSIYVPAGESRLTVRIGLGSVEDVITVAAGETVEKDIILGLGHASVNAFYVEGMKVEEGGLAVEIYKGKKDIQGNREYLTTTYGPDTQFDLPPGDYVALLSLDSATIEAPFTIAVGEAVDVAGVLGAGVLAVTAPNAYAIELFSAKKDIQGNRKSFGLTYDSPRNATLPAGDYIAVITLKDNAGTKESPVATVAAGERTEITVE